MNSDDDRIRWRDPAGVIYEWDSQDGALQMFGAHGWHLGEYDHIHGSNLKLAEPGRKLSSWRAGGLAGPAKSAYVMSSTSIME